MSNRARTGEHPGGNTIGRIHFMGFRIVAIIGQTVAAPGQRHEINAWPMNTAELRNGITGEFRPILAINRNARKAGIAIRESHDRITGFICDIGVAFCQRRQERALRSG
ncbi:hypothetical protein ACN2XU_11950 [Primorskyibacter sp. 2E107]